MSTGNAPGMWRTAVGEEIPIVEMQDAHLLNTILFLDPYVDALPPDRLDVLQALRAEAERRGILVRVSERRRDRVDGERLQRTMPPIYLDTERGQTLETAPKQEPPKDEGDDPLASRRWVLLEID